MAVSLRGALESLPDDRTIRSAARGIAGYIAHHPNEPLDPDRISRVTGSSQETVDTVLQAFAQGFVIDSTGSGPAEFTYTPTTILSLELDRYLRTSSVTDRNLRDGTQRFRSSYGR
ncbi:MAG TPA: hypothetical protein VFG89_04750 [Coriobacteriia bacterium]|nr:hypothetical protein [Coriobacteriia bacterium]